MTERPQALPPVVRTVEVAAPPARAFAVFTAHLTQWWPLPTHSVHGDDAARVDFVGGPGEPGGPGGPGGTIVERSRDGDTCTWGTVLTWVPGVEVSFTWHPGAGPDRATRVRVRFEPCTGGTRVVLEHDGWEQRPDAAAARARYDVGWEPVLTALAASTAGSTGESTAGSTAGSVTGFRVVVSAGSLRSPDAAALHVPHRWTPDGVTVLGDFTGAHLLHLSAAGCVLNDLYREAAGVDVELRGARVTAGGGFDAATWASTGIEYAVEVDSPSPPERIARLLDVVDRVAEIPRALRAGAPVRRST